MNPKMSSGNEKKPKKGRNRSPLANHREMVSAIADGNTKRVEELLEIGVDKDWSDYGETALCYATQYGHREIFDLLVESGADVNKHCPLHYTVFDNRVGIAEVLIEKGASVDGYGNKIPLREVAMRKGRMDILMLLLSHGANVNHKTSYGSTALHSAASWRHVAACKILLEYGADPTLYDGYGYTPYQCADNPSIKSLFSRPYSFLPSWRPKFHPRYPGGFRTEARTWMMVGKRLKLPKDVRLYVVGWLGTVWRLSEVSLLSNPE